MWLNGGNTGLGSGIGFLTSPVFSIAVVSVNPSPRKLGAGPSRLFSEQHCEAAVILRPIPTQRVLFFRSYVMHRLVLRSPCLQGWPCPSDSPSSTSRWRNHSGQRARRMPFSSSPKLLFRKHWGDLAKHLWGEVDLKLMGEAVAKE